MYKDLRIVLLGPGAIGASSAAFIKDAGCNITIVAHNEETANIIKENGITVTGKLGYKNVKISTVKDIEDLEGIFDIVLITTKAYQMEEVAKRILPYIRSNSLVVSMQNGIVIDKLAEIVGKNRTVGCVIGYGATLLSKGNVEITSTGEFIIGKIDNQNRTELLDLQSILDCVFPTIITNDILSDLYSKIIINSCITSLGAVCGLRLGQMLKLKKVRIIFLEIVKEAMKLAEAMNLKVPNYAGKLNYYKLVKGNGFIANFRKHSLIKFVGYKYRLLKSSSLQSLQRGQITEVDYLNGFISKQAKIYNIKTPINDQLLSLIKDIEQGKLKIDVSNLDKDVFKNI